VLITFQVLINIFVKWSNIAVRLVLKYLSIGSWKLEEYITIQIRNLFSYLSVMSV